MKGRQKWKLIPELLQESTEELFNPARGWYQIYTFRVEEAIDPQELRWSLRAKETMVLALLDMSAYRRCLLDQEALEHIRAVLRFFMQYQKDVILRPVYDCEGKGQEHEPEEFSTVLAHLKQLGELLQSSEHSVCIFQGLLIGSWGEMHHTRYASAKHLRQLAKQIEPYLGTTIYLAVRTPSKWRLLTEKQAYEQEQYGNRTLFDDGILGSSTHLGTFGTMTGEAAGWEEAWNRKEELDFIRNITQKMPCGGEVVADIDGKTVQAETAVKELKKMHLSYLNSAYDQTVLEHWKHLEWKEHGIWDGSILYDYIGNHLGYRLTVREVKAKILLFGKTEIQIIIENVGFGTPFQEMEWNLLMETHAGFREYPMEFDTGKCYPGERRTVKQLIRTEEGKLFLELYRKKDKRKIYFANKKGADRLLLGSLHRNF